VIPARRSVGLTGTVAKVSAGAVEHLPVACVPNLSRVIEWLKERGVWVYALDPSADKPYTALDLQRPVALVLGGEGKGIRPGVLGKCDDRASIPMRGRGGFAQCLGRGGDRIVRGGSAENRRLAELPHAAASGAFQTTGPLNSAGPLLPRSTLFHDTGQESRTVLGQRGRNKGETERNMAVRWRAHPKLATMRPCRPIRSYM